MRYFQLLDDMHVTGRWHLADPRSRPPMEAWAFRLGQPIHVDDRPTVALVAPGRALTFTHAGTSVPLATAELAAVIGRIAPGDVQCIPAVVEGCAEPYAILNTLREIDCLDEHLSIFTRWTPEDGEPDRVGQYRMITKLRIDSKRVPGDVQLFRIAGWRIALVVSERIRGAMERAGCFGAVFHEVSSETKR